MERLEPLRHRAAALVFAFWSRVWFGWWSVLPIATALAWTWLNPRVFPPARSDAPWIAKGVLGERLWTRRGVVPVPEHHRLVPHLLNGASATGGALVVWGVADLAVWPTLLGAALATESKLRCIDCMAWLYADLTASHPDLRCRGWPGRAL